MKKVKVSEATGPVLDWMVAKCMGLVDSGRVVIYPYRTYDEYSSPLGFDPPVEVYYGNDYRPTTDWSQGGPIIEREKLDVLYMGDGIVEHYWRAEAVGGYTFAEGPTPLIAAMRCYVASKLGDVVDVPEEPSLTPAQQAYLQQHEAKHVAAEAAHKERAAKTASSWKAACENIINKEME